MLDLDLAYLIGLIAGCIFTTLFGEMTRDHETLGAVISLLASLLLGAAIGGVIKIFL